MSDSIRMIAQLPYIAGIDNVSPSQAGHEQTIKIEIPEEDNGIVESSMKGGETW